MSPERTPQTGPSAAPSTPRTPPPATWQVIAASVRGASHVRGDRPNQDAIAWRAITPGHGLTATASGILLAISDGHGSPRYLRSHQGAKIAVHTALDQLQQFLEQVEDPATLKRQAEEQLPRTLVRAWQDRVVEKLDTSPLSSAETGALDNLFSARERAQLQERPQRIFGATLLAAIITPAFGLFLQLGDGDIITVGADGTPARLPLAEDARLFANQTTSLAGSKAWQDVRVYFLPFIHSAPALIFFATDGYANSFQDEAGLLAAAADLHGLVQAHGPAYVRRRLKHWLGQTSTLGSGDDISAGLVISA